MLVKARKHNEATTEESKGDFCDAVKMGASAAKDQEGTVTAMGREEKRSLPPHGGLGMRVCVIYGVAEVIVEDDARDRCDTRPVGGI